MSYYYGTNNNLAMYIDPYGNIGFGTSNVNSNAITVSGTIIASTGIVNSNGIYAANLYDRASLPSFTWSDTSNYGLFRASNNVIGFSIYGNEAMRINQLGYLGIGISNPMAQLHAAGIIRTDTGLCNYGNNYIAGYTSNIGNVSVSNNMIVNNTFCNFNIAYFASNLIVGNNLNTQGLCNFGNTYFASNLSINSNLLVSQNVFINNTFSNLGNAYFASNITGSNVIFGLQSGVVTSRQIIGNITTGGQLINAFGNANGAPSYAGTLLIKPGDITGNYWGGNPSNWGADLVLGAGNVNQGSGNNGSAFVSGFGGNVRILPGFSYVNNNQVGNARYVESGKIFFYNTNTNGTSIDTSSNICGIFDNYGRFGLNTSNPKYQLDVNGIVNSSGGLINGGFLSNLGNMAISGNLNTQSLCNYSTSYFASNVTLSNSLTNLGNAYFASNVVINNNLIFQQNNGSVTINTNTSLSNNYTITLPSNIPNNSSNIITLDSNGNASFVPNLITNFYYNSPSNTYYAKIWTGTSFTSNGKCSIYPTNDNTSNGTPLFSNIYFVSGTPGVITNTFTQNCFATFAGYTTDRKQFFFNCTRGTTLGIGGGSTTIAAADGTTVLSMIVGS